MGSEMCIRDSPLAAAREARVIAAEAVANGLREIGSGPGPPDDDLDVGRVAPQGQEGVAARRQRQGDLGVDGAGQIAHQGDDRRLGRRWQVLEPDDRRPVTRAVVGAGEGVRPAHDPPTVPEPSRLVHAVAPDAARPVRRRTGSEGFGDVMGGWCRFLASPVVVGRPR